MAARKRILVSGRVQGVFFRDSCRQEAERLGLAGTARNLDDGRVEVVAEGDEAAVDKLVEWCKSGPSHADVSDVSVEEQDPQGASGFRTN